MLNLSASRLEVNGIATRLLAAGRGDALVLLVHGAGGRADRWAPTLEALAAYAAADPAGVRALVLSGSLGLVPVGREVRRRVQAGLVDQSPEGVRAKLLRLLGERLVTDSLVEEDVAINNSPGARESLRALGEYIAQELDNDVVGAQLAASRVPVLLLHGERDTPSPLIPGARSVVVPDAGHAPYLENPHAFNRAVIDFLHSAT